MTLGTAAARKLAVVESNVSDFLAMKAPLADMVSRCDSEDGVPVDQ